MDSKNEVNHEERRALDHEQDLSRTATIEINNYHGLSPRTVLVYLSICLIGYAQLMNVVGAGAFARNIALDLEDSSRSVWLPQAIAIVTVILGPPVSQAADLWGRKWFLVVSTVLGAVGAVVVSRASSMGMAIAGQVICGFAFGSQPLLYAVASEILPRRFRPAAQGGLNAALALGGITALLGGEAMVRNYTEGFRVFFYTLAAIYAVSAATCAALYSPPPRSSQLSLSSLDKAKQLDWVGYILLGTGMVLFVMALSWADNPYPWRSTQVLAPLLIGIMFIAALICHQTLLKKDGLLHHDLFRMGRNFGLCLLIMLIDGMAFYAVNNYFPFEISVLFETDPVWIGLRFGIVFFAAAGAAAAVALYSSWSKDVRLPIVVSFALCVVFFGCMTSVTIHSSTAVWVYPVIIGLGLGMSLTCLITIAQLSTPPALIAIASGLVISIRSLGASVGLAIYTSIFNTAIASNLGKEIAAAVLPLGLSPANLTPFIAALASNDEAALFAVPGVTATIVEAGVGGLKVAYLQSFKGVWIAAAVLSGIAMLAACLLTAPKAITMHVDAPLESDEVL